MFTFLNVLKHGSAPFSLKAATTAAGCLVMLFAIYRAPVTQQAAVNVRQKRVGPPAQLRGAVYDENGSPLPKAIVFIYTAAPRIGTSPFCPSCYVDCSKRQATDAHGSFLFPELSGDLIFRLLILAPGCEPTFASDIDPLRGPVKITLRQHKTENLNPDRRVVGRVLDPSGRPVAGATVEPIGLKTPTGGIWGTIQGVAPLAITNDRGEFRFDCPKIGSTLAVRVKARGLAPKTWLDLKIGAREPYLLSLEQGAMVAGTVQNAEGRKMAGVTVEIVPIDRDVKTFVGWFEIGTDQDGRFSLPNLPSDRKYVICVRMDSLAGLRLGAGRRAVATGKEGTTTAGVRLIVQSAAALTGRVGTTGGKPIPAGTRIMLGRFGTWDVQQSILAADGTFTFQAVPQDEELELFVQMPNHHLAEETPGYDPIYHEVRFKIPAGASNSDVKVTLSPNDSED